MCVDCVLASLRIAQDDPGQRTTPQGGSVIEAMEVGDTRCHGSAGVYAGGQLCASM
jgi:hypothetical protein